MSGCVVIVIGRMSVELVIQQEEFNNEAYSFYMRTSGRTHYSAYVSLVLA